MSRNHAMTDDWSDDRNYYKVEKWTKESKVDRLLLRWQQSRQGARDIPAGSQAPATDQADNPATDAGAAAMAG
jgi:hypothetical protein